MEPQATSLYAAVAQGQAIQCTFQQEVDIIIPAVLNADAELAEKKYICHPDSSLEPD